MYPVALALGRGCARLAGRGIRCGVVVAALLVATTPLPAQSITNGPLVSLPNQLDYVIGQQSAGDTDYLFTETEIFTSADHGADWNLLAFWPAAMKLGTFSRTSITTGLTFAGPGTSTTDAVVGVLGARNAFYSFDLTILDLENTVFITGPPAATTIAYDPQGAFLLGGSQLYNINTVSGAGTNLAINNNADSTTQTLTGMTFGPDHQLYVLDSFNRQVERFDVSALGTAVANGTMAIGAGLDVNFTSGLAIGPKGTIYLADDSGGGDAFNFDTGFLTAFTAPTYDPAHAFPIGKGGAPFIEASADGNITVYNPAATTDLGTEGVYYSYFDASAVPEPASFAGLAGVMVLGAAGWWRRYGAAKRAT